MGAGLFGVFSATGMREGSQRPREVFGNVVIAATSNVRECGRNKTLVCHRTDSLGILEQLRAQDDSSERVKCVIHNLASFTHLLAHRSTVGNLRYGMK